LKQAGAWRDPSTYKVTPSAKGDKWTVRNVYGDAMGTFTTKESAEAKALEGTRRFNSGDAQLAYTKLGGNAIYSNLDKGAASAKLREAGIPGIKYLDGNSRNAGQGSYNYVIFDPDLIEIQRKYANHPDAAKVSAALEAMQAERDQQQQGPVPLHYGLK
jgi:hypothetical protein